MGADSSISSNNNNQWKYSGDMIFPITSNRDSSAGYSQIKDNRNVHSSKSVHNLVVTAFHGIWSMEFPTCLAPIPRTGFFFFYDKKRQNVYVGYGFSEKHGTLDDVWELNVMTRQWREIKLHGEKRNGRGGAKACLIGDNLLIFGGYSKPNYYADLHTINIITGEVKSVTTNGHQPEPRSSPIVAFYNGKYYMWGGFNNHWQSELNVLDFKTNTWSQYQQGISGRTAVPFVIMCNVLYSFGCSKSGGMLTLNFDTNKVEIKNTIGVEPPSSVIGSGMVRIGKYALFFGGKGKGEHTLVYACDLLKMWWFVFHILPDGKSVTLVDGKISEFGLFMLPRIHSFGYCYVKEKREVLAYLGYPEKDPPPLFIISIGEALAFLNLRDDMIDIFQNNYI